MPIVLSTPPSGTVQGRREITWTSRSVVQGGRQATWTSRGAVQGKRLVTWSSARALQGARLVTWTSRVSTVRGGRFVTWPGSRPVQGRRQVVWNVPTGWPVVQRGHIARQVTVLSSNAGQVISAQYSHSGTRETLNLTVVGRVQPSPQLTLSARDLPGASLDVMLDGDLVQFEQRQTPTGWVTTLHGYNKAASRLGSARLPELIPWKLSPTPVDRRVPCAQRPKPQEIAVSKVLSLAFKEANMTPNFSPYFDPFAGQTFVEGLREYSTLGKTPDQVLADLHGQLGFTYVVRDRIAQMLPPGGFFQSTGVAADALGGDLALRREAGSVPSLVTVTGADLVVDKPSLLQLADSAPDPSSLRHELARDAEWYVTTPTDSGETIKGFRKVGGVVTGTAGLTLSDVTAQETVDNVLQTRTFSRVVTGFASSTSLYDPLCTDMLVRQDTVKQSFSYTLTTGTNSAIFSGPGFIGGYQAGDPLGDEQQTILQTWSPEGYLQARTTITRKLVSVKQQDAEAAPKDRGTITANEYLTTVLSESWQPVGGGWLRVWSLSGAQQLPLYDAESGEAVRLTTRGGTPSSGEETLDSAPPQARCPDPCAGKTIGYPQTIRRVLRDGREGQEQTRNLPFVASAVLLNGFADLIAGGLGPSEVSDLTLSGVQDWRPGVQVIDASGSVGTPYGVVEAYTLDASAGFASVKLTARRLLEIGSETLAGDTGPGPYRDQVTWRSPGGVFVNHFKGVKDDKPEFDRIFVRCTGANLPNPGDELEWRNDTRFGPTATGNYGS